MTNSNMAWKIQTLLGLVILLLLLSIDPYSWRERWSQVPLHVTHEDSDEVKNLLQTFCRSLQNIVGKTAQEDEKISQVLCKKLWQTEDTTKWWDGDILSMI